MRSDFLRLETTKLIRISVRVIRSLVVEDRMFGSRYVIIVRNPFLIAVTKFDKLALKVFFIPDRVSLLTVNG